MNEFPTEYCGYQIRQVSLRAVAFTHYWLNEPTNHTHPWTRAEFDAWKASLPAGVSPVADCTTNHLMGEHIHIFADSWEHIQVLRILTRQVPHWVRIYATPTSNVHPEKPNWGNSPHYALFLDTNDRGIHCENPDYIDWETCKAKPIPGQIWIKPEWLLPFGCGPFTPVIRDLKTHVVLRDAGVWETVTLGDQSYFLESKAGTHSRYGIPVLEMKERLTRYPLFAADLARHYPEKHAHLQDAIARMEASSAQRAKQT